MSPDVLPHKKIVKQVRCDLRKKVKDEAEALKEGMPAVMKYLDTQGFVVCWMVKDLSKEQILVEALLVVVD